MEAAPGKLPSGGSGKPDPGVERQGDLPGELILYYYFEYLRMRQAMRLVPIFHPTRGYSDARLPTAIVPPRFARRKNCRTGTAPIWLAWRVGWRKRARGAGAPCSPRGRSRHAGQSAVPALVEIGLLEKKLGRDAESVAVFTELTESPNRSRGRAYQELAKHYEHRERNYTLALDMVRGRAGDRRFAREPPPGRPASSASCQTSASRPRTDALSR